MKTFKEMEDNFYRAVRRELVAGLEKCTEKNHRLFKQMYGHLDWSIRQTVARMSRDKLSRAMEQVGITLGRLVDSDL
jgi:hypothetical protein